MTRFRPVAPADRWEDASCRRAAPGTFDPLPSVQSLGRNSELRADRARWVEYAARYCNGTDTRAACAHRAECLLWALETRERVVAGGVEVTLAMIKRYREAKRMEVQHATEATAPADQRGELAERRRQAGRRQPARSEAEGAA